MRGIEQRLSELEQRLAPAERIVIYQESLEPAERGLFRRGAGWRGRADLPPLLTRRQVREDAAGATVILIEYESNWRTPAGDELV